MVTEKMIEAFKLKFHDKTSDNLDYNARLRVSLEAALSTDAEPVMFVSEQQLAQCVGHYVPSRKTAEGNFQLALYRAPPAPAVAVKADRLAIAKAMCESDGANWEAATANHTANGETPEDQREYWLGKADVAISALPAVPAAKLEEKP